MRRIEIVHQSDDTLQEYSTRRTGSIKGKAQRILCLKVNRPDNVFSISGAVDEIDPTVSKNTRIILGGAAKENCVKHRYNRLRAAGFNVVIYNSITLNKADLWP